MCISCRVRLPQRDLYRFLCEDKVLKSYKGIGRSFYLCDDCLKLDEKKLKRTLSRVCKTEIKKNDLEKILNG